MMLMSFMLLVEKNIFENGICLIEWGEIIESILPKNYTKITFRKSDDNPDYRELCIEKI